MTKQHEIPPENHRPLKPKSSLRFFLALPGGFLLSISSPHRAAAARDGETNPNRAIADNWHTAPPTTDIVNFNQLAYGGNPSLPPDAGRPGIDGMIVGSGNGAKTLTTTDPNGAMEQGQTALFTQEYGIFPDSSETITAI